MVFKQESPKTTDDTDDATQTWPLLSRHIEVEDIHIGLDRHLPIMASTRNGPHWGVKKVLMSRFWGNIPILPTRRFGLGIDFLSHSQMTSLRFLWELKVTHALDRIQSGSH